jgi:hypothetical protein
MPDSPAPGLVGALVPARLSTFLTLHSGTSGDGLTTAAGALTTTASRRPAQWACMNAPPRPHPA